MTVLKFKPQEDGPGVHALRLRNFQGVLSLRWHGGVGQLSLPADLTPVTWVDMALSVKCARDSGHRLWPSHIWDVCCAIIKRLFFSLPFVFCNFSLVGVILPFLFSVYCQKEKKLSYLLLYIGRKQKMPGFVCLFF